MMMRCLRCHDMTLRYGGATTSQSQGTNAACMSLKKITNYARNASHRTNVASLALRGRASSQRNVGTSVAYSSLIRYDDGTQRSIVAKP